MPKQADLIETLNIYTIDKPYIMFSEVEINKGVYMPTSNYTNIIKDYRMIEDGFRNAPSKIFKVFNTSRILSNFVEEYWQAFQSLVILIANRYNYIFEQVCYDSPMILKYQPNSQRILKEL